MNEQQQPISIDMDILRDKLGQHEINELMAASMIKNQAAQIKNQANTLREMESKMPKPELPADATE